eukprot:m.1644048 g.1644048  ORF g.1644048 m.1644048 type:complete len:57 (-) comp60976_c0_seq1:244-414(-)
MRLSAVHQDYCMVLVRHRYDHDALHLVRGCAVVVPNDQPRSSTDVICVFVRGVQMG